MKEKVFTVDARTILTLGRDSIKDHTTALLELVKNSYDADATIVEVEIMVKSNPAYIRIVDNGCGMSEKDIDNYWLRIGYSEKSVERVSSRSRRKTGEKGIGRISADRLGETLELNTQAKGKDSIGLKVNWEKFNVAQQDISQITIDVVNNPVINIPRLNPNENPVSGTELIISQLRQTWTVKDLETLQRELSFIVSPFHTVNDFNIRIKSDLGQGYEENVDSNIYENYDIRLDVEYDGVSDYVDYTITDRAPDFKSKKSQIKDKIKWDKFSQDIQLRNDLRTDNFEQEKSRFGPILVTLLYYPQTGAMRELITEAGFKLSEFRTFLTSNAGVKIYRDNIRVRPYGNLGEPDGDWLGLGESVARNPAGAGRPSFLIRPTQLVGAVFVSRDKNPQLVDSSSREGLIHGEAFLALKDFVLGCARLISAHYHQKFTEGKAKQSSTSVASPSEDVKALRKELGTLRKELQAIRQLIPEREDEKVEGVLEQVENVAEQMKETEKSIQDLETQTLILRGLATIGIAATVFGHETQTSIDFLVGATNNAKDFLRKAPPQLERALDSLEVANKSSEKIAAWGSFALDRVRRDKRRRTKLDIRELILGVLEEVKPILEAVNINVESNLESIQTKTFAMDIESLLLNLLTNAYTACNLKQKDKVIRIELTRKDLLNTRGYEIVVADSGPGIDKKFQTVMWTPLFSTKSIKTKGKRKQIGTGLGLSVVQSIVEDLKGTKEVDSDPILKGARFKFWFPIQEN